MSDKWRISGGLGEPEVVNQVMTQGLGFPLRPISGVLPTTFPPVDDGAIAEGAPMQWMGDFIAGKYYPQGAFVRSGIVTAVANTFTLEDPEPVPDPDDPESTGLPDPWVGATTQSDTSVVSTIQLYTFNQTGWIKRIKIFVPTVTPDTSFRLIVFDAFPDNITAAVYDNLTLSAGEWKIIALPNLIVPVGNLLRFTLESHNSSATTNISGGWQYAGPSQSGAPPTQGWTQDNQRVNFRIDKTDLDSTDRSAELEGVIQGSELVVVETANTANTVRYIVQAVVDNGTYMSYVVTLQLETGTIATNAICTLDIDVPISLPTDYAEEAGAFATPPSWASEVTTALHYDGVDQAAPVDTAYGIDILFEPASISNEWDIVSLNT